jgi:D-arabinose 1-dehydrogenase-like Zn-dependent alcohol dehydrogenase
MRLRDEDEIEKELMVEPEPNMPQDHAQPQITMYVKEGLWLGLQYPRITGHEIAGVVDAFAEDVKGWKVGDRVGVGWYGGHCGYCDSCRRGVFELCLNDRQVTGFSHDGGYAEYTIAHAPTLARMRTISRLSMPAR